MKTQYCLKVFEKVNNRLTSVSNVYPITYRRNQWNKAPEGTGLFVYTEKSDYINEFDRNREVWLCEYRGLKEEYKNFFHIFCSNEKVNLSTLQTLHKLAEDCSYSMFLVDSVKPLEKLDYKYSWETRDQIVYDLLSYLRKKI